MSTEVQCGKRKKVMEIDGTNGCTTMGKYLTPMKCRFESGKYHVMYILPTFF